jgi:dipeptidyl aminopeptidase/acylaminoacyl peptidase
MIVQYKTALTIIVAVIGYIIITSLAGFYYAIRPPFKTASTITPADLGLPYENVSFHTQDNVLIRGWFIPNAKAGSKAIILLHGYPADKGDILPSRAFLHRNYNLLFIDFRHLGNSGGHYTTLGKNEVFDLLAAIQYLKQHHIKEIGIWGLSLGGAVALMTAQRSPDIHAIVSESSYANLDSMLFVYYPIPFLQYPLAWLTELWGKIFLNIDINNVSPVNAITNLKIPILLIHSKADQVIPFSQALLLQKSLRNNTKTEFLFSNQLQHGELSKDNAIAIQSFFNKNL